MLGAIGFVATASSSPRIVAVVTLLPQKRTAKACEATLLALVVAMRMDSFWAIKNGAGRHPPLGFSAVVFPRRSLRANILPKGVVFEKKERAKAI